MITLKLRYYFHKKRRLFIIEQNSEGTIYTLKFFEELFIHFTAIVLIEIVLFVFVLPIPLEWLVFDVVMMQLVYYQY